MELNNLLLIIYIIINSIQYRNKVLIFNFLIALVLTRGGFITEVIRDRIQDYHFTTAYKFIERNNWNCLFVHQIIMLAIIRILKPKVIRLIIDDTYIMRSRKKKIPHGGYFYDHSHKPNRPDFIWGQNLIMMAAIVNIKGTQVALPVLASLLEATDSNHSLGRILTSRKMIDLAKEFLDENRVNYGKIMLLADAFFAKKNLIHEDDGLSYILQTRRDTVLYSDPPERKPHKRGRPPKYGKRIIVQDSDLTSEVRMFIYGKWHTIHYTYCRAKARFLNGRQVMAVFMRFDEFDKVHLIISTDTTISPVEILQEYSGRNLIENTFYELKNQFGLNKQYFQHQESYEKMLYLKLWTYILLKITSTINKRTVREFVTEHLPWRIKQNNLVPVTTGVTQMVTSEYLRLLDFDSFQSKVREILKTDYHYLKKDQILNKYLT
ncbi:MAG TPA: transposase [Ignavibacteriales bacterium]|nr:transposase [Ignavibacteriales bacterium]